MRIIGYKDMAFSAEDKHIIVGYHYVRNETLDFSGIHPCSVSEFERQIKFLSENYVITSIEEVYKKAAGGDNARLCAVTLDDCTKDHYINALPILEKYKATATFFPITSVFSGILPLAHRIHMMLSRFTADNLIDDFNEFLMNNYRDLSEKLLIPKSKRMIDSKRISFDRDFLTDNFKERLTTADKSIRENFLKQFFIKSEISEKELFNEFFMDTNEIKDLCRKGFIIGNHTHSHDAIDIMDKNRIIEDVSKAENTLFELLDIRPNIFSYPYGRTSRMARNALEAAGIEYAVTIEGNRVLPDSDPLVLPRYDTNNIRDYLDSVDYGKKGK